MNDTRNCGGICVARWLLAGLSMAFIVLIGPMEATLGEVVFFGPTPYLSQADSPFPVDGSHPNFYLEDFEDGELNTPGIAFNEGLPLAVDPVVTSGSVDGDDGLIDGLGQQGHSLAQPFHILIFTDPGQYVFQIDFTFDSAVLGELPNAFGFAWTEGAPNSNIQLTLFDELGNQYSQIAFTGIGDDIHNGNTDDHVFIGATAEFGIARARITSTNVGGETVTLQIDHVQYGQVAIPEPEHLSLLGLLTFALVLCQKRLTRPSSP